LMTEVINLTPFSVLLIGVVILLALFLTLGLGIMMGTLAGDFRGGQQLSSPPHRAFNPLPILHTSLHGAGKPTYYSPAHPTRRPLHPPPPSPIRRANRRIHNPNLLPHNNDTIHHSHTGSGRIVLQRREANNDENKTR